MEKVARVFAPSDGFILSVIKKMKDEGSISLAQWAGVLRRNNKTPSFPVEV